MHDLTKGSILRPVAARQSSIGWGPTLDLLQLMLDDADQADLVRGGEVGRGPLEQRPYALRRIQVRRLCGQSVNPQPVLVLRGEGRLVRGQADVEVIPDPDQRG